MKFFLFLFLFFSLLLFSSPQTAHAAVPWGNCFDSSVAGAGDVATVKCLPVIVLNVTNAFLLFAGAVSLFIIVWAGIRYITSGGDAKQMSGARSMITYAIIGLIVVLSSYALLFFIGYVTKTTNCITNLTSLTTGCT